MDPNRFDGISRLFASRRLSRRNAVTQGAAVLAAGAATMGLRPVAAQEATPAAEPILADAAEKTPYLFVQSFQGGSVAPKEGAEGTYTLTLEQGLGQTIYFSDRPERIVGASPTADFIDGLGFVAGNPPNAALVAEIAPGETDIAVVELLNPTYDEATHTATYDVQVLENWSQSVDLGFHQEPGSLADVAPEFGAAHLFIDDCADGNIYCHPVGAGDIGGWNNVGYCWEWSKFACVPCESGDACPSCIVQYWADKCNNTYPQQCEGNCRAEGWYVS